VEPTGFKVGRPYLIVKQSIACEMLAAVRLHDQTELWAIEVQDIGTELVLATKFRAVHLPVPETTPQSSFSIGEVMTKPAGWLELLYGPPLITVACGHTPSP
jgi:hypothetical protein